jgi:hypothetical protein
MTAGHENAGRNKTDVIDAEMLAQCQNVLGVHRTTLPSPAVWGLRRAMIRRHRCTIEAHRADCRLWSLAMWAFPDLWRACGGHQLGPTGPGPLARPGKPTRPSCT